MNGVFRIGTRKSRLARWQTERIIHLLGKAAPDLQVETIMITTTGDRITDVPLANIGSQGVFTKELENALLDGRIDAAVHSMKDLESELPDGLMIGAVPERSDVRDALISEKYNSIGDLPEGAAVFTGSLRRKAQLLGMRPDIIIRDIRGNVETRLKKFRESDAAGLIMAAAGMQRLGLSDHIAGYIPVTELVPAVGQGALAVEIRADDERAKPVCALISDTSLELETGAERRFLRVLQGGCRIPAGAYAVMRDGTLTMTGTVTSIDGSRIIRRNVSGNPADAESLGERLANEILNAGGAEIINELRGE